GRDRQVLCVTHLPQVAACADAHLLVSKQAAADGAPTSTVAPIAGEARTREVARMLGGERISDTTLAHALEMLNAPAADDAAPSPTPRGGARKARSP
ncbi:MAG TPA: DNA repair protein RecN, partial [Ottowia sp.]|nr:DNA repair protein RecN [Ottowia sp.]